MLLSLTVENFRSIQSSQTLSMIGTKLRGPRAPMQISVSDGYDGVLANAVIYGANASGKSTLVSAIHTMRGMVLSAIPTHGRARKLGYAPFALDRSSTSSPTMFEVRFLSDGVRYDFGFSHDERNIISEWLYSYPLGRRRMIYERAGNNVTFGPGMKGPKKTLQDQMRADMLLLTTGSQSAQVDLARAVRFFEKIFVSNSILIVEPIIRATFREKEIDERVIKFLAHIGTGVVNYRQETTEIPSESKAFLRDLFRVMRQHATPEGEVDSNQVDPEIEDKEFKIQLGHRAASGEVTFLSTEFESTGTQRLLVLLSKLFQVIDSGDIAFVDELDASLHTSAVDAIFTLFNDPCVNKKNAQLIATTHDTNLLNPKKLRRDEIWFVEKSSQGATELFSLAEISSREAENFEMLYLSGRYGAIPQHLDLEFFRSFVPSIEEK